MSVWKKNDLRLDSDSPGSPGDSLGAQPLSSPPERAKRAPSGVATVGPSIAIDGTVTGDEDLLVQGKVTGKITLVDNTVTIGDGGRVKAEIHAKSISVEGQVEGDLVGGEEVVIHPSGSVQGNILAPRVSLESGCRFKGSIDMEKAQPATRPRQTSPRQQGEPATQPAVQKRERPKEVSEPALRAPVQPAIGSGS